LEKAVGTIYKVKPAKSLNIFDAGADRDFNKLFNFRGTLRSGRKPLDCLLDMVNRKRKFSLQDFQKLMAKGDWSDLVGASGLTRSDWINTVIGLGFDGYLDHEALEGLKPTITVGIFNPKNLKIVDSISGAQLKPVADLYRKNANRALELNDINDI
jgi:hypothetical protein